MSVSTSTREDRCTFKFRIIGVGNGELTEECEVVECLYLYFSKGSPGTAETMEPVESSKPTLLPDCERGHDECLSQDVAMRLKHTGLVWKVSKGWNLQCLITG